MKFIVTVKLPRNPNHNPQNKKAGTCPATGKYQRARYCTDTTGEHHSFLIEANDIDDVGIVIRSMGFNHVTRVESVIE